MMRPRALAACAAAVLSLTICANTLEERFDAPPDSTKPYVLVLAQQQRQREGDHRRP